VRPQGHGGHSSTLLDEHHALLQQTAVVDADAQQPGLIERLPKVGVEALSAGLELLQPVV
jgi:hypothetical protein